MVEILAAQNELCNLLQQAHISTQRIPANVGGSQLTTRSLNVGVPSRVPMNGFQNQDSEVASQDGVKNDIFSENLDLTLQLLEEEGEENLSMRESVYGDNYQSVSISTNCSLASADTSSIASSHGDYDIPFEESLFYRRSLTLRNSTESALNTNLAGFTTSPLPHKQQRRISSEVKQLQVDSALDQLQINEEISRKTIVSPPYFFIDFDNDRISPIQPPKSKTGMVNSNLCYQSPLFPNASNPNKVVPSACSKTSESARSDTDISCSKFMTEKFSQRLLTGICEESLPEHRYEQNRSFGLKSKKHRSKSSIGFASKKSSNSYLSYESDASSCKTQSTVRSAYKQKTSKNRSCVNCIDVMSSATNQKRYSSNQSQVGTSSLTDDCGSVHSAFTDAVGEYSRKNAWFSREKRKRIKKMLKMYNEESNTDTFSDNSVPQNASRKVVLAEL
ncbi:uncharacterized protein LOC142345710 [Convolutriloba macropyga]|uniref:uncharacterized protein LOC142345710 n=1 Tax=Convolutriloba macropyga TaxID=536237 RepID=UPI003F521EC6